MKIPFIGGYGKRKSPNQSAQTSVNLYMEIAGGEDDTRAALYMVPGKSLFASIGGGPIRGMLAFKDYLIVVSGGDVYRIVASGASTLLGVITNGTSLVGMAAGGDKVVITSDGDAWYTEGIAVYAISDTDYLSSNWVAYVDGYFVFSQPQTRTFFISEGLDSVAFNGLDFAQAESGADSIERVIVDHQELWVFCRNRIEVWYNSGASDFPFARRQGSIIEAGCASPASIAQCDNTLFWLGRTRDGGGVVYRADQYTPQIISNRGIESVIACLDQSTATAWAYQQAGHTFYCLSFDSITLVYDASIGDPDTAWHIRSTYNRGRDRAACHAYAFGLNLVGDNAGNQVMELNTDVYDDLGEPIVWERTSPRIFSDSKRIVFKDFTVNIEAGVGLRSGQGSDPVMYLDWSDDGGHTWSMKREISMGLVGRRLAKATASRLGSSRNRVFRLSGSEPVKTVILGAYIEAETGEY